MPGVGFTVCVPLRIFKFSLFTVRSSVLQPTKIDELRLNSLFPLHIRIGLNGLFFCMIICFGYFATFIEVT